MHGTSSNNIGQAGMALQVQHQGYRGAKNLQQMSSNTCPQLSKGMHAPVNSSLSTRLSASAATDYNSLMVEICLSLCQLIIMMRKLEVFTTSMDVKV